MTFLNEDPVTHGSNALENVVLLDLGQAAPPSTVPEPTSLGMLGMALAIIACLRRRAARRA